MVGKSGKLMNKAKVFAAIFGMIALGMVVTMLSELEEGDVSIVNEVSTIMVENGSFVTEADAQVSATPKKQMALGVLAADVKCNEGLVFVKKGNGQPACIKPTSVYSLFNRGWVSGKIDFENIALDVAKDFVISAPTFAFDGILHTLDLEITQVRESFPEQFVMEATFESRHGGFGDRAGQMVTQVITPHKMNLVVAGGKVISATIDEKWDELNQVQLGDDATVLHGGPVTNYISLVDNLIKSGAQAKLQGQIEQPFFSTSGRLVDVDGQTIQIFEYESTDVAKSQASTISKDGTTIGTSIATWVGPPHFYQKEKLIVLYIGDSVETMNLLESILGQQIAGSEATLREFSITYTKDGGIAGISQKVMFDSSDGMLAIEGHNAQTLGPVDSFAIELMLEVLNDSNFFELGSNYPPVEGSADYFTYTLHIVSGSLENKVSWTDTSENVPQGLAPIAQEIEQFILDYQ